MKKLYYILAGLLTLCLAHSHAFGEEIDINKIIQIESGGDSQAYNGKSGAIGLCQITPICLLDYNEYRGGYNKVHIIPITLEQLYYPGINVTIGTWYLNARIPQMLKAYGLEDTIEARLFCYSVGIGTYRKYLRGEIKMPKETRDYIRKYKE